MKENERYELYAGTVTGTGWPIDGHKLVFSLWEWDNRKSYHLTDWGDEDDEAVMLTMFQAEVETGDEDADGLEEFSRAWHAGEYDPPGVFCISKDQLTDVEKIDRSIFVTDAEDNQEKPSADQWKHDGICEACRRKDYCKNKCKANERRIQKERKKMARLIARSTLDKNIKRAENASAAFRRVCAAKRIPAKQAEALLAACRLLAERSDHPQHFYIEDLLETLHRGKIKPYDRMVQLIAQYDNEAEKRGLK